jgi:hypothetical protein
VYATQKLFHQLIVYGVLIALDLLSGSPSPAQIPRGCTGLEYIGADSNNPFTAEYLTTDETPMTDGAMKITVSRQSVARDGKGRIRLEVRPHEELAESQKAVTVQNPDGSTFTAKQEELSTTIEIVDCKSGKEVTLHPGMRFATVIESGGPAPPKRVRYAYSRSFFPPPGEETQLNRITEALGSREIHGIRVLGVKWTTLGTEKAGKWTGKPISEEEFWVSDDLSIQFLRIGKNLQNGSDSRLELTAIKRGEPDPALFEIPKDFRVNPAPGQGPFIREVPLRVQ